MKKMLVCLGVVLAVATWFSVLDACAGGHEHDHGAMQMGQAQPAAPKPGEAGAVDVKNKFCPVSGDPVSAGSYVIYEGKRYNMCCDACKDAFLKDPQKYIKKMEEQEKKGK